MEDLDSEIAKESSTETRIKGYRVKVEYGAIPENEIKNKKATIGKTILNSLKNNLKNKIIKVAFVVTMYEPYLTFIKLVYIGVKIL